MARFLDQKIFCLILIVVLGFLIYGNTLDNELFWDDDQFILDNQYIKNWEFFPHFFTENVIAGAGRASGYWRPALLTIFSLEWHLWGASPFGFHLTNTLFHIADAILLFLILERLFKKRFLALFAALIFLVHPLQTEAVSYANSLGDSLSVFFMFGSILLFLKYRQNNQQTTRWYGSYLYCLSLGSFALALMSKETAIVTPILITLVDIFREDPRTLKEKYKDIILTNLPFYLLGAGYVLLRATALNFVNTFNLYNETNDFTGSILVRFFTFLRILTVYLGLIFLPINLHMERSVEMAGSLGQTDVLLGGLILLTLLVLAFRAYKKYPLLSFGILWFFIALSPTSNILVPINGLLYEHWLYVPLVGAACGVYALGSMLVLKIPKMRDITPILAGILILVLAIMTVARNRVWDNSIAFYQDVLEYAPGSYRIWNNLGMELSEVARQEEAEAAYLRAIALDGKNPIAYHNLGNTYIEIGKRDLAIKNFNQALYLDPDFYYSYGALANLYLAEKNYAEAEKVLKNFLERDPNNQAVREALKKIEDIKKQ